MMDLAVAAARNAEVTIKGILARAASLKLKLTREEVLEELKFYADEDTTVWGATVDRLMGVQA